MPKYDVFISYSRKDFEEVKSFKDILESRIPGINIWFDVEDIEIAEKYTKRIIEGIDNSPNVIFCVSDNSMASEWTEKEIRYAASTQKRVIPVLLKEAELKGWYLFEFGSINCADLAKEIEIETLIKNLCKWIGNPIKPERGNIINGHEYVDLGLSVKWATCNIGANSPEEYGDYFAWGEISTKPMYTKKKSETYCKTMDNISKNLHYDAPHTNWGGSWRLPTKAEIDELLKCCTWEWTSQDGHTGYQVTSPNGNSIFLPAAGYRYMSSLDNAGSYGNYWTSTPCERDSRRSYDLYFGSLGHGVCSAHRYNGQSIRPVCD